MIFLYMLAGFIWKISLRFVAVWECVCEIFAFTEVHNRNMLRKSKYYKTAWLLFGKWKTTIICCTFRLLAVLLSLLLYPNSHVCFRLELCLRARVHLSHQTSLNFTWNTKRDILCAYGNLIWMIGLFYNKWIHTNSLTS